MEGKKLVLTVELDGVRPGFEPQTYAAGIAFRGLPWVSSVKVKGKGVDVKMESKK